MELVAAMPKDAPPNGGAPEGSKGPWQRVWEMQAKLHRWAAADPGRRFDDVFNFVHDPATLTVAFARVAGNRGANTPGVDGITTTDVEQWLGVPGFLEELRTSLKEGSFRPLPVRQRRIPKPGGSGKLRKLGIPTVISYCPSCNRVSGSSYWSCCAGGTVECHGAGWHRHFVIRFGCGVWCVELRG
jgi:hypothetical protein